MPATKMGAAEEQELLLQVVEFIGVPGSRGTQALCAWTARLAVRCMYNTGVARRRRFPSSPALDFTAPPSDTPAPEASWDYSLDEEIRFIIHLNSVGSGLPSGV